MSTDLMENPETGLTESSGAMAEVAVSRAAQEVQAAMIIAKRFPRNETAAFQRITKACSRMTLAKSATYCYPKGGQRITGPSIRLAEVLAQNWGNIDFGIIEIEQRNGESDIMAYAWDLETNTRQTKVFTVKHERHTKSGNYRLTDPREIYETTANQGARRLRSCILGVIPGDIVDEAVAACEKTLAGDSTEPIGDRARKMVVGFSKLGVTQSQIETFLGHSLDSVVEIELVRFQQVYLSLKDNMAEVHQYFPPEGNGERDPGKSKSDELADHLGETATPAAPVDEAPPAVAPPVEPAPPKPAETTPEPPPIDDDPLGGGQLTGVELCNHYAGKMDRAKSLDGITRVMKDAKKSQGQGDLSFPEYNQLSEMAAKRKNELADN